jgi:hypothetical protein
LAAQRDIGHSPRVAQQLAGGLGGVGCVAQHEAHVDEVSDLSVAPRVVVDFVDDFVQRLDAGKNGNKSRAMVCLVLPRALMTKVTTPNNAPSTTPRTITPAQLPEP